jgi:hypothetical protein
VINGFKKLEFMHLLAPAGEIVLTSGVALKLVPPQVSQNHLPVLTPYELN